MKKFNKSISRLLIINHVVRHMAGFCYGDRAVCLGDASGYWRSGLSGSNKPPLESLVMLSAAPNTKWYLSWLKEVKDGGCFGPKYLLESIEDGSLSWWENVAVNHLPLAEIPQKWRWTDQQHNFNSKVFRTFSRIGAYMVRPKYCTFGDGNEVTISARRRHTHDGEKEYSETFPNFKKVLVKDITAFYERAKSEIG